MAAFSRAADTLNRPHRRNGHDKTDPSEMRKPAANAAPENAPQEPQEKPAENSADPSPAKRSILKPILLAALLVGIVYGAIVGIRYFRYSAVHVSTDNATISSDITQIAPQVTGTVTQVLVKDNQEVKAGDLLVVLDDATYKANVAQAQANLDAAIAQAQGAGVSVALTSETGGAQVTQAQGVVSQAESGIASAKADVAKASATVYSAKANASGSQANVLNAQAAIDAAVANKQRYRDAVTAAQAQVDTARASVRAAQATVDATQSVYEKNNRDADRYTKLATDGAVSEQTADQARTAARQLFAQVENARQQVAQAQATVAQKQADLNGAKQQLEAADAAIAQARAQLKVARDQAAAASAGITQAQAAQNAAQESVRTAEARRQQALGQLAQAHTLPRQVSVSKSAQVQAQAKIEQMRAALDAARIQLNYTRIYAPVNGRINKKSVEVGALVQPGTPLMAVVQDRDLWVTANFKETQLNKMRIGQPVEIEVDTFSGRTFKGHVDSIAAGTGATFALLPPDNATGNFTKVVQRVPVKIVFEPNQRDLEQLRTGMSVVATVSTK